MKITTNILTQKVRLMIAVAIAACVVVRIAAGFCICTVASNIWIGQMCTTNCCDMTWNEGIHPSCDAMVAETFYVFCECGEGPYETAANCQWSLDQNGSAIMVVGVMSVSMHGTCSMGSCDADPASSTPHTDDWILKKTVICDGQEIPT